MTHEIEKLRADLDEARTILAGTAIGSLPNDYPLSKLALETWNTLQERTFEGLALVGKIEQLGADLASALKALRPFAAAYYWDNGDVTLSTSHITQYDYRSAAAEIAKHQPSGEQ